MKPSLYRVEYVRHCDYCHAMVWEVLRYQRTKANAEELAKRGPTFATKDEAEKQARRLNSRRRRGR